MTTFNEGRHAAEFILSEAAGMRSRENGTVESGQTLVAGQIVELNAGKLIAYTAGVPAAVGIMIDDVDATGGDVEAAYIARDAEVNGNIVTFPAETTGGGERATSETSLEAIGIIVR